MYLFSISHPATCELCGQWMPRHSSNCPRSGIHPSQWSHIEPVTSIENHEYYVKDISVLYSWTQARQYVEDDEKSLLTSDAPPIL